MENLEKKKELLKNWINEYINKFIEHGLEGEVMKYQSLNCRIDFSLTKKSIEKVEHLFNIRSQIEQHIINKNFNKKYKKLNEKLIYNFEKMIKQIYWIDVKVFEHSSQVNRVSVFDKTDLEIYTNQTIKINK